MAQFTVTIDNTKIPGDLTDFPVYINLADMPASFWGTVKNGGGDIRVYKSDGTTELAREVVSCDTTEETGELHIKYSGTLSSSVDTVIIIDIDGERDDYAVDATYGRNNVWSGYVSRYSLNSTTDSKGVNDLTNNNSVTFVTGKIGNAANFVRTSSQSLSKTSVTGIPANNANHTMSIWFSSASNNNQNYLSLEGRRYIAAWVNTNLYVVQNIGGNEAWFWEAGNRISTNTWYYIVVVRDGSTSSKLYINGSLIKTFANTPNSTVPNTIRFGGSTDEYVNGKIDEGRIVNGALTADWITTEYNNQNSPSTFYSVEAGGAEAPNFFMLMA